MNFSWVPFYRELAGKVLEFEDRQDELLKSTLQLHQDGLLSNAAQTLDAIDPFTFFSLINTQGEQKRQKTCDHLRTVWNLQNSTPTDFWGVPELMALGCWFFRYNGLRQEGDIKTLWQMARANIETDPHDIPGDLWRHTLAISSIGLTKLTIGMFWLNPQLYFPIDKQTRSFFERNHFQWNARKIENGDWGAYRELLERTRATFKMEFPRLSRKAWEERNEPLLTKKMNSQPLNTILYGPPGTGKTYDVTRRAIQLIEPDFLGDAKTRFEELRADGRIIFVTFHQSFSYEEFVEGLRPVLDDEEGQAKYEIRNGVLKRIQRDAFDSRTERTTGGRPSFDQLLAEFWKRLPAQEWKIPGISDGTRKPRGMYHVRQPKEEDEYVRAANIAGRKQGDYWVPIEVLRTCWDGLEKGAYPDSPTLRGIWGHGFQCNLGGAICLQLQKIEDELKPNAKTVVDWKSSPRYVLVIDEINRGNVSKIFGELITLLEEDKRVGAENELRLTLPISGETFALPPNLHILGTMNTADKSLAQLDVALRRRFEFEELAPRPELCDKLEQLPEVLTALNERLEWALDREHRLGHAYFMDVDNEEKFNERFRSKVVPLLIEYFPHDFKTLRAVLGESTEGFLREFKAPPGFSVGGTKYRWWFEIEPQITFSAFEQLKKNFGIS